MDSRFEDFVGNLTNHSDVDAIWGTTAQYSYALGFTGCSLVQGQKCETGIRSPSIMTSFSQEFKTAYSDEGLGEIDPFLLFTCKGLKATKIVTRDLSSFAEATPCHKLFLERAADNGAVGNLGVPVRSHDSMVFGGWVLSNNESEDRFNLLEKDHGYEMHLAAVLAYERMVALGLGMATGHKLLSPRERECLLWLCAGLRVSMIADKLSISTSAVNLYIANSKHKLEAKTREQAVARAIFSGEIEL